ncbi:MAG: MBL fold metallo-hydrolase [Actinobacteria bacterium]|nr:MAG: MBL fold metallo-hydrolase [Actinomycetota bacterium]
MRVGCVRYTARMPATHSHSLRIVVLGSGSSGNAIAVTDGVTSVLIDCGFSARETARRMATCGLDAASTAALLLTHEHSDHVRGVEVFSRRHPMPVFASDGTRRAAGLDRAVADPRTIECGAEERIGTLRVVAFATSHDAAQPLGFRVESDDGERVGIVTDTGIVTEQAHEALAGCDLLAIESNHDVRMLERGRYPQFLKSRILSHRGHLANAQSADALEQLATDRLRHVIALHRSRENNTEQLVLAELASRLTALGLEVPVTAASQTLPCWAGAPHGTLFAEKD